MAEDEDDDGETSKKKKKSTTVKRKTRKEEEEEETERLHKKIGVCMLSMLANKQRHWKPDLQSRLPKSLPRNNNGRIHLPPFKVTTSRRNLLQHS